MTHYIIKRYRKEIVLTESDIKNICIRISGIWYDDVFDNLHLMEVEEYCVVMFDLVSDRLTDNILIGEN